MLELHAGRRVRSDQAGGESLEENSSTGPLQDDDPLSSSVQLLDRFERFGNPDDLQRGITLLQELLRATSVWDHRYLSGLSILGTALLQRFERFGELGDLEEAIPRQRDAVDFTPHGHPSKPSRLSNLANGFLTRFQRFGELSDLEDAILTHRDAVDLTPHAIFLYMFAASVSTGPIRGRFQASKNWISYARQKPHHSLLHAYSAAISLLPELAWIGLSLSHRYDELARGADMVREAAAAALDSGLPETAVEWLEQGRSVVWGELFQLRNSYEELLTTHPDHACRLRELSAALEHASVTREKFSVLSEQTSSATHRATESSQQVADKHRALAIERDQLLQEIRGFPDFEQYLLHKEFSQLRASAHSGPVVILNTAESRCDALIVLADLDHVFHVPLPTFTFQRSAGLQNMLEKLLGNTRATRSDDRKGDPATLRGVSWESLLFSLWNGVVKPVLDALAISVRHTPGELSRIFWCPTGPFVFLPIHAAGLYGLQHSRPGHKVSDFVVSSYVPTLSILMPSSNPTAVPSDDLRLLAVRQPLSDGLPHLSGVAIELEHIREIIRNSPSAQPVLLESSVGTVEEVLDLLKQADWVHFACHGIQDPVNRTDSGLCLADRRRLKVSDIIALSRPHGGLAFLSACQTAMGDDRLSDEAIHIAAGMLFAGHGGVIGTMWSISDKLAPEVAWDVYQQLFRNATRPDYREAAQALHDAIGRLQERGVPFHIWLPFIHVGL
ncbi:hypothetical protein OG21DRAFT_1467420 [Imleria badia]|nr:hypothetical protein OG21DRAFT_1467420 [Imleria badia]